MAPTGEIPRETLRTVDANLNRTGEGLRVLEDIARFTLNDATLSGKLKAIRHGLVQTGSRFQLALIESRDAAGDVGRDIEVAGEQKTRDLKSVLVANARRVQESLRVLEEFARVPGISPDLDSRRLLEARFAAYSVEQEMMSRLTRREMLNSLSGLYVVLDGHLLKDLRHEDVARLVIRGGAKTIELREGAMNKRELIALACELRELCAFQSVLFLVNDHLDVVLASGAHGLHVSQSGLPVAVARGLLRPGQILGCSVSTEDEARSAETGGADYLVVGPVFASTSGDTIGNIGPSRLRQVKKSVSIPVVAIGGIGRANVAEVMAAGAAAAAVSDAVLIGDSPELATREIVRVIEATT